MPTIKFELEDDKDCKGCPLLTSDIQQHDINMYYRNCKYEGDFYDTIRPKECIKELKK